MPALVSARLNRWGRRASSRLPDRGSMLRARSYAVTAAAAGASWAAAAALSTFMHGFEIPPIVAAITAVLTVRTSLNRATGEAGGQLVATLIGAVLAVGVVGLGWPAWLGAVVVVFGSFVLVGALRLGEAAGIGVPVTALIVLGPGLPETTAIDRLLGTVLGALIAVAFSYFTHPDTPAGRAADAVAHLSDDVAALLADAAGMAAREHSIPEALECLERARELNERVPSIREACEDAIGYARWYPRASQAEAAAVYARFLAVEHTVVTVRAITRSLVEVAERNIDLSSDARETLSDALGAAAVAAEAHAATMTDSVELAVAAEPDAADQPLTGPVHESVAVHVAALEESAADLTREAEGMLEGDAPDLQAAAMTASVAVSLQRIAESLAMDTDAIRATSPTPSAPTAVTAVNRLAQGAATPMRFGARLARRVRAK